MNTNKAKDYCEMIDVIDECVFEITLLNNQLKNISNFLSCYPDKNIKEKADKVVDITKKIDEIVEKTESVFNKHCNIIHKNTFYTTPKDKCPFKSNTNLENKILELSEINIAISKCEQNMLLKNNLEIKKQKIIQEIENIRNKNYQ